MVCAKYPPASTAAATTAYYRTLLHNSAGWLSDRRVFVEGRMHVRHGIQQGIVDATHITRMAGIAVVPRQLQYETPPIGLDFIPERGDTGQSPPDFGIGRMPPIARLCVPCLLSGGYLLQFSPQRGIATAEGAHHPGIAIRIIVLRNHRAAVGFETRRAHLARDIGRDIHVRYNSSVRCVRVRGPDALQRFPGSPQLGVGGEFRLPPVYHRAQRLSNL